MTLVDALLALHRAGKIPAPSMPGMIVDTWADDTFGGTRRVVLWDTDLSTWHRWAPVVESPATVGVLLALLRGAAENPNVYVTSAEDRMEPGVEWVVTDPRWAAASSVLGWGDSEGEAITAAFVALAEAL